MDNDSQARPQVVSLDWLAFSVTLALTYEERLTGHAKLTAPPGYTLVECNHGTPQYKRRYYLQTNDGDKVATLLLEPHSSIMDSRDMYVEVANAILYNPEATKAIPELIAQVHEHSFKSLSRIDVACDFQPDEHQKATIAGLQDMTIYAQGKREGAQFHDYHLPITGGKIQKVARCMSWGSKQSSVKWKLYNKSLELYQPDKDGHRWCTKPYIPATWAKEGMGDAGVWRLECSLTGASSYMWRGEKMSWKLIEEDTWREWYWDMVATRFQLRKNEGHVCRKNDTLILLLDIPTTDHYRLREREGEGEKEGVDHASTLRMCIKELQRPETAYSDQWRALWLNTTYEVLNRGKLHGYFLRAMGMTFEEWATTIGDPLTTTNQ